MQKLCITNINIFFWYQICDHCELYQGLYEINENLQEARKNNENIPKNHWIQIFKHLTKKNHNTHPYECKYAKWDTKTIYEMANKKGN